MNNITKQGLKDSSKIEEFKPTPAMIVFVDTAIRLASDNVAEITREAGIDESNYYKWNKLAGFAEWMENYWNKALRSNSWKLDVIGLRNSKRDFNYWKSMQQRTGKLQDDKGSVNVQVNVIPILGGATKDK